MGFMNARHVWVKNARHYLGYFMLDKYGVQECLKACVG